MCDQRGVVWLGRRADLMVSASPLRSFFIWINVVMHYLIVWLPRDLFFRRQVDALDTYRSRLSHSPRPRSRTIIIFVSFVSSPCPL